jgi:hypothetical protein
MRLAITLAALLLPLATADAAVGNRYMCNVANVQNVDAHGRSDAEFIQKNMRNRYDITVTRNAILVVYNYEGQTYSKNYPITGDTELALVASKSDLFGVDTLALAKRPNPRYNNAYTATLTVQGSFFANAWILMCSPVY